MLSVYSKVKTKDRNRFEVEAGLRLFSDKLSVLFSKQFCHHKNFFYIAFNFTMRKNYMGRKILQIDFFNKFGSL